MGEGKNFFRERALLAERRALEVADPKVKLEWQEIAIEWHTLANFAGREQPELDLE